MITPGAISGSANNHNPSPSTTDINSRTKPTSKRSATNPRRSSEARDSSTAERSPKTTSAAVDPTAAGPRISTLHAIWLTGNGESLSNCSSTIEAISVGSTDGNSSR